MRHLLTFCVVLISVFAFGQTDVYLNINHLLGDQSFSTDLQVTTADEYELQLSRVEYYMSNIVLTHDGAQTTSLGDLTLLVDANDPQVYALGNHEIYALENISFSIGVLEELNHLDPSTFDADHPLMHQAPSMHWGWAFGYKFLCFEGMAGAALDNPVEIHALGDANYMNQNHALNAQSVSGVANINLDADYLKLTSNLDVSNGLAQHGMVESAVDILLNMRSLVFSTDAYLGADELSSNAFQVFPIPARGMLNVVPSSNEGFQIALFNLQGEMIRNSPVRFGATQMNIEGLAPGIYILQCESGKNSEIQRLVIN